MTAETFFNLYGQDMASSFKDLSEEDRRNLAEGLKKTSDKDVKRCAVEYAIRWFQIANKTNSSDKDIVKGNGEYGRMPDASKYELCRQYADCDASMGFMKASNKAEFKDDTIALKAKRTAIACLHLPGELQEAYTDLLSSFLSSTCPSFLLKNEEDASDYAEKLLRYGYETDFPENKSVEMDVPEVDEKEEDKTKIAEEDHDKDKPDEENLTHDRDDDQNDNRSGNDNDKEKSDGGWLNDGNETYDNSHNDETDGNDLSGKMDAVTEVENNSTAENAEEVKPEDDRDVQEIAVYSSEKTRASREEKEEKKEKNMGYSENEGENNSNNANNAGNAKNQQSYGGFNFETTQSLAASDVTANANSSMKNAFQQTATVFHSIEQNYDAVYKESVAQKAELRKLKAFLEYHRLTVLYNSFHYNDQQR